MSSLSNGVNQANKRARVMDLSVIHQQFVGGSSGDGMTGPATTVATQPQITAVAQPAKLFGKKKRGQQVASISGYLLGFLKSNWDAMVEGDLFVAFDLLPDNSESDQLVFLRHSISVLKVTSYEATGRNATWSVNADVLGTFLPLAPVPAGDTVTVSLFPEGSQIIFEGIKGEVLTPQGWFMEGMAKKLEDEGEETAKDAAAVEAAQATDNLEKTMASPASTGTTAAPGAVVTIQPHVGRHQGKCLNGREWTAGEGSGPQAIAKVQFLLRVWSCEMVNKAMTGLAWNVQNVWEIASEEARRVIYEGTVNVNPRQIVGLVKTDPEFWRASQTSDYNIVKDHFQEFMLGDFNNLELTLFAPTRADEVHKFGAESTTEGRKVIARCLTVLGQMTTVWWMPGLESIIDRLVVELNAFMGVFKFHSDYVVMRECGMVLRTFTARVRKSATYDIDSSKVTMSCHAEICLVLKHLVDQLLMVASSNQQIWEYQHYAVLLDKVTKSPTKESKVVEKSTKAVSGSGVIAVKSVANATVAPKPKESSSDTTSDKNFVCPFWVGEKLGVVRPTTLEVYKCVNKNECVFSHYDSMDNIPMAKIKATVATTHKFPAVILTALEAASK